MGPKIVEVLRSAFFMVLSVAEGSHTGSGTLLVCTFIGQLLAVGAAHIRLDAKTLPLSLSRPLDELPLFILTTATFLVK